MGGDGQVTAGSVIVKPNVQKVRRLGDNIVVGFAGSTADALTLFERLEDKLVKHPDQLMRACVELAKAWRTDKYLRKLEVSGELLICSHIIGQLIVDKTMLSKATISTLYCYPVVRSLLILLCVLLLLSLYVYRLPYWWPTPRTPSSSLVTATCWSPSTAPWASGPGACLLKVGSRWEEIDVMRGVGCVCG